MNAKPHEKMLKLYAETMAEIFTPEEHQKITLSLGRNFIDMHGPEDLKKRLYDAVCKKTGARPSA